MPNIFVRALGAAPAAVALAVVLQAGFATAQDQAAPAITVGENVQVSRSLSQTTYDEVLVDANPNDPNNLVGCSIVDEPDLPTGKTVAYASFDGGASWTETLEAGFGDPACTFANDGRAIFTTIGREVTAGREHLFLIAYYSLDGGRHWTKSRFATSDQINDRDYVAVDRSPSSRYYGNVYISGMVVARDFSGHSLGGLGLYSSTDGAKTFRGPVIAIPEQNAKDYQALNLGVLSDGTVVVLANNMLKYSSSNPPDAEVPDGNIRILRWRDGGQKFDRVVKVADVHRDQRGVNDTQPGVLAIDSHSAQFKDRIYVAWVEYILNRTTIVLSYSSDRGNTWSPPRVVSDEGPSTDAGHLPNNMMPDLAVNKDGVVGLSWYDRRDNPDQGYYVRFSASLDGGQDWLPSVRVSTSPKTLGNPSERYVVFAQASPNPNKGPITFSFRHADWITGGHTSGLAADARGTFHAFWVDNRTGFHQVWTAPISVVGETVNHEATLAKGAADVTSSVEAHWSGLTFDEPSQVLSFDLSLTNTGKAALRAPVKILIANIYSARGQPEFVEPASSAGGAGAVADVSGRLRNGALQPGETLSLGHFAVRLAGFHRGDPLQLESVLQFDMRVYAEK